MQFIHTSDWHIGRQFHNIPLLEDQKYVLDQLIQYLQQYHIDALVISGDIYDRSVPSAQAVSLLDTTLSRICLDLKVPVILIPGNHDSACRLGFGAKQLELAGLHIISRLQQITTPVRFHSEQGDVSFYCIPYADPEAVRQHYNIDVVSHEDALRYLVSEIDAVKDADSVNIVLSHCFIDGAEESDSERPLSVGGADRVSYRLFENFDYAALGHLHGAQHKGGKHIRYSGSILKYSFSEQWHKKAVTLVRLDNSGLLSTASLPLNPLRNMRVIEGELEQIITQGRADPDNEDYILVRLTDRHALLDPMNRLRDVYANVVHLEKPGMLGAAVGSPKREQLKRNEIDMFQDFFQQVHGDSLTPEQLAALTETIQDVHIQGRDVP